MAEGPHDRLKRYLSEAYSLEDGVLMALKSMAEDCKDVDAEVAVLFTQHAGETQRQMDRLKARMAELDTTPSGTKHVLTRAYAMGEEVATAFRDSRDKVENHLMAAYETEAFEMATYSALEAAAQTVGDEQTARLAHDLFLEEQMTSQKIFPHIARFSRKTMLDAGAQSPEEQEENATEYASKGYVKSS